MSDGNRSTRRFVSLRALAGVVFAAWIPAVIIIIPDIMKHDDPKDEEIPLTDEARRSGGPTKPGEPTHPDPAMAGVPTFSFGDFDELDVPAEGVWDEASTDGFLLVFTSGARPAAGVDVRIYNERDDRGRPDRVRCRATRYDGTTCPVSRGQTWHIVPWDDGNVEAFWLPMAIGMAGDPAEAGPEHGNT